MDLKKLISRYKQFGGAKLVWQYVKLGVLPIIIKGFVKCLVKKIPIKTIYPVILKRVEPFLHQKYGLKVQEFKKFNESRELTYEHPKVIWWCWLQGIEQAPNIVTACYNSLKRNLPEYNIRVINAKNWKEYVELPEYIKRKWEKKQIPPALFSDLLRLQLLVKYGGTWIDSTVLCTGNEHAKDYLDADLFLFQYTPKGTIKDINISNWFISTHSNNEVLMTLRDMLFAYWKDYNCTLDYYIFHLFFKIIAEEYPETIASMPYGYSMNSLVLLHHWGEAFGQKKWDKLIENVCFHKLAHGVRESVKYNKNSYYNKVIELYK